MHRERIRGWLFCGLLSLCSFAVSAQTPTPTPEPPLKEGYHVTSSIELGVRGLSVNGDHEKYRSDLNYRSGFRVFDSSFLIENTSKGSRLFDSALIATSGFGADPSGSFRSSIDKTGTYKFDANVRRVRYFNDLKNHVLTFSQPVSLGSQHRFNTVHNFGDFDLTVFPVRDFRIRLGYSFNDTNGPGTSNIRFSGDEYQVNSDIKAKSHDLRAGVEGLLLGFNVGLNYGHRTFRDRSRFRIDGLNVGNNPATTTSFLTGSNRDFRVDGKTNFIHSYAQRTFAGKLDFSGRLIYSNSVSDMEERDLLTGRASATGNIILGDEIGVPGRAKRTQARADIGFTYRVNEVVRFSNTVTFDQFNVGGSHIFSELVRATTGTGGAVPNVVTNSLAWRATSYRRISNLAELDFQPSPKIGFNIGLRIAKRRVTVALYDVNLLTRAVLRSGEENLDNSTGTFVAGVKFKPTANWRIYADVETGDADNVFTRLANNDFTNFRIRSNANAGNFTLSLSFVAKNNENPGTSLPIAGVAGLPSAQTLARSRTRIFSSSVDWTPRTDLWLTAGYTYSHQTSNTDIIMPVGTPIFPTTRFLFGVSEYYSRDSHFFFDINVRPHRRVSLFASYRINDDRGQGDRVQSRPQDIISSYPMRFQTPEARVAIRLTRNVDWNIGYQYYSYRERSFTTIMNLFATPTVVIPAQNYTAHMPFTSLRIYFGRPAGDR